MKKLHAVIFFLSFSLLPFNSISKIEIETYGVNNNIDNSLIIARITNNDIEVISPKIVFFYRDPEIKLKFKNIKHTRLLFNNNKIKFIINGEEQELLFTNGETTFNKKLSKENVISILTEGFSFSQKITFFPLWEMLLVIAIIIGLVSFWMVRIKKNQ